jgi:hypothetical protein
VAKFDSESAKAAQAASAETQRRQREMTPEQRALDAIGARLGQLTNELLEAALGRGDFAPHFEGEGDDKVFVAGLKPETRVSALIRAMEWRLGRPSTVKLEAQKEAPSIPTGADLFET